MIYRTNEWHDLLEILIARRLSLGFTQAEVAERCGLKRTTLCNWEAGRYVPAAENLLAWIDGLRLDLTMTPWEEL